MFLKDLSKARSSGEVDIELLADDRPVFELLVLDVEVGVASELELPLVLSELLLYMKVILLRTIGYICKARLLDFTCGL